MHDDIIEVLKKYLDARSYDVVFYRFGLDGNDPLTLEEIGKKYNITRERIRQIEANAIKKTSKLSKTSELDKLRLYVDDKNASERKEEEKMNKMTNIYSFYQSKGYTESEIDAAINSLNDEYKELLRMRFGDDLHNPTIAELPEDIRKKYYSGPVTRLSAYLKKAKSKKDAKSSGIVIPDVKSKPINKIENDDIPKENDDMKIVLPEAELNTPEQIVKEEKPTKEVDEEKKSAQIIPENKLLETVKEPTKQEPKTRLGKPKIILSDNPVKKDAPEVKTTTVKSTKNEIKEMSVLKRFIKSPLFQGMTKNLPLKECLIVSLKFGYVGKEYTTEEIATFLEVDKDVIEKTFEKGLNALELSLNDIAVEKNYIQSNVSQKKLIITKTTKVD